MKRNHVYFGFAVLFVLLTTMQAQAGIQSNPNNGQNKGSKGIVFVNQRQLLQIARDRGVKVRTFKISKHELAKLAASDPKGCGCAMVDELDGFGSCFKGCLQPWVNNTLLAICGAACIAAGTANPVGIAICAACLGVSEWIVAVCAAECVRGLITNAEPKTPLPLKLRRGQTRGGDSAKLTLHATGSGALF